MKSPTLERIASACIAPPLLLTLACAPIQAAADTLTHGKHFLADTTQPTINGQPNVAAISLADGPTIQPQNCCHRWQARVAAGAYLVASGMLCTPAWALGAVDGWICGGAVWALGQLPDFDNACR
jgi:hypothetical protein